MTTSTPLLLGYLGPQGSHSSVAAQSLVTHQASLIGVRLVAVRTLERLLESVACGRLQHAVVPIENRLQGAVVPVMEFLGDMSGQSVAVQAEFWQPIAHALIQRGDTPNALPPITTVISHPQALNQCQKTLRAMLGDTLRREWASSTAEAVQQLATRPEGTAALGAAQLVHPGSGLCVVADNVSDRPDNATRFLWVSHAKNTHDRGDFNGVVSENAPERGHFKTMLSVELEDAPGCLARFLTVFDQLGLNLTRIESRPSPLVSGRYRFFLDVEGALWPEAPQWPVLSDALTRMSVVHFWSSPFMVL